MCRTTMSEDCPICMDPMDPMDKLKCPVTTACGHCFCKECVIQWVEKANSCPMGARCPMCRAPMNEKKQPIVDRFFLVIFTFYAMYMQAILADVLDMFTDTEFPEHHQKDSAIYISYVSLSLLMYSFYLYTKDIESLVVAKQRGVTADALESVFLVFMLTGIAICLVPSLAFFSGATAVMGLVLIMPRAWDMCMCFSALLLYMSYSLPVLLKFMATIVLSVLTEFPVIGAMLNSPLMANAIVIMMIAFVVRALQEGFLLLTVYHKGGTDIDLWKICYYKRVHQLLIWTCKIEIYSWTCVLDTCTLSTEERAEYLQIIQRAENDLARARAILSELN